jgi:uncharacterized protein (DUF427 family)
MSSAIDKPTRERGRVRVEHGTKRIRAFLGGELVADTRHPLPVWEKPYYPTYYIPEAEVRTKLLFPEDAIAHSPSRGDGQLFTVKAGGKKAAGALELLTPTDTVSHCPYKGDADYWSVRGDYVDVA